MSERLLEVKNLSTSFFSPEGEVKAVNDVSYYIDKEEIIAVVGESGCGKSVTQLSVLQLVQTPPGKIKSGEVIYQGRDLLKFDRKSREMLKIRGSEISMIFQEPMTSLNPVFTVGYQLIEMISFHMKINKKEAEERAINLLIRVGIPDPKRRMKDYPFQMSGGMRQRVMIALAISCNAKLIIADEPTTALDVTTQAQIMEELMKLVKEMKTSLIIVTHNLGLVARYAERIYVMYAGKIIEHGKTRDILHNPKHPYTKGLLASVPRLDQPRNIKLVPIDGAPPKLLNTEDRCMFYPRCKQACEKCKTNLSPSLRKVDNNGHYVACSMVEEIK